MAEMTLTQLRKDLFRAADQVLETGEPVVVRRRGRVLELREGGSAIAQQPSCLSKAERMRRYFAQGPRPGEPDQGAEEIEKALKDYWVWTEPEKLNGDGPAT